MKTPLVCAVIAALLFAADVSAGPRDAQWKSVEAAIRRGLPQTAIAELEPIVAGALADKAHAETIKAVAQKVVLEGNIQGNKPEERLLRLQAALEKMPAETKPALEALLGHWYWHFFLNNRWRFLQRTSRATA